MKVDNSLMGITEEPVHEEKKAHQPRARNKRAAACIVSLALAGAALVGGILAYQTKTESQENIFLIGNVKIEASEPGFPTKDDPVTGRTAGVPDDCELMTPYKEAPKDPRIKNTGNNDCVVFFRVTVPVETLNIINDDGTQKKNVDEDLFWMKRASDGEGIHGNRFNTGWTELNTLDQKIVSCAGVNDEGKGKTYIFGWHAVLKPGQSTATLFDKVQNKKYGSRTIRADEIENIKVESFAIQAEFVKRAGIDISTDGEISESDLTYLYKTFVNQNEGTVGKGEW